MSSLLMDHPMVICENWDSFTQDEHRLWNVLFERQSKILEKRAANEIMEGLKKLNICDTHIPKFCEINEILQRETNFSVVPVSGLIPEDLFFRFLAERKFPSTCFLRKPEEIDYLQEPDIFHDLYGHVPLLVNPIFADFMEEFGHRGVEALGCGLGKFAATLYWFTVEFGLVNTPEGLRIYGSGITSSKGESIYCLESDIPARVKFDVRRVMKTQYHIDSYQRTYFVVNSYDELFQALRDLDWKEVMDTCLLFPEIEQGVYINSNEVIGIKKNG